MSASNSKTSSSAAGPAAGYFFQLRFALLKALQLHRKFPTGTISIELIDDVTFTHDQIAVDNQLKHSIKPGSKLSGNSPAFWRTIAIWIGQLTDPTVSSRDFHLVSTSSIPDEDPLKEFAPNSDEDRKTGALEALKLLATQSTNKASEKDRELFLSLTDPILLTLLKRVTIFEEATDLGNLAIDLDEALHWAAEGDKTSSLREDLEGWWYNRVFNEWSKQTGAAVVLEEVASKVHFFRGRYGNGKLRFIADDPDCTEILEHKKFIRQLRLVTDKAERIRRAQKAYLMAQSARSRWVREFSIDPEELAQYDDNLFERWEAHQIGILDEIEDDSDHHVVTTAGKKILHWAETSEVRLRNLRSTYLTSGSYHALAESMRLGWHPNYEAELSK